MNKIQIYDLYEAPPEIIKEIEQALTENILERYDNTQYHDPEIIERILHDYGYEINLNLKP